ncbi:chorismate mutase [Micromonospora sediminicola]
MVHRRDVSDPSNAAEPDGHRHGAQPAEPDEATTTTTGAHTADAARRIELARERIDAIDAQIIDLWRERSRLSGEVGSARVASGGTRLVLARERVIMQRFRSALGADGTQLALLLLRAGRGPL